MGIRFRCHHCECELHVKDFQAGKRGRCPECHGKFRIPPADAPHSLPPDASLDDEPLQRESESARAPQTAPTAFLRPEEKPTKPKTENPKTEQPKLKPQSRAAEVRVQSQAIPKPPNQEPTLPRALQTAADSQWYVRPPSGGQFGPAPSPTMWQWLGENRVGRDALVWCEGWPEWLIAENVFDDHFLATTPADSMAAADLNQRTSSGVAARETPTPQELGGQIPPHAPLGPTPERPGHARDTTALASQDPSLSDRNRAGRKQKRRRNYTLMIAVLTVIMLLLIGALIVVLLTQQT